MGFVAILNSQQLGQLMPVLLRQIY